MGLTYVPVIKNSAPVFTTTQLNATTVNTTDLNATGFTALAAGQTSGNFTVFGSELKIGTVGGVLKVAEGANATMGVATMAGGTVTVATNKVTANSRIQLTVQSLGTVTAPKAVAVTARTPGTSFVITSSDATDTSVVAWHIVEAG